ncbi:MAG TPA: hypothetical protein VI585_16150 [Candidatus Binatia bacterium]
MARLKALYSTLFLAGMLVLLYSPSLGAVEGIISKAPDPSGQYCHLRFPAIRKETIGSNRPVLKDPSEGDIIDFYGPCDYDPLGKTEVQRQRMDLVREFNREYTDQSD